MYITCKDQGFVSFLYLQAVLQEKASVQEILAKSEVRATSNYALAAKLAQKIGELRIAGCSEACRGNL